jgi:cobalt/nickel transport system permease protein
MPKIDTSLFEIGTLDRLAAGNTVVHALDPRAKLVATLAFILTVVSFGRYEVAALLPLLVFPLALSIQAQIPGPYLLRKLLIASPFAVMVGMFNPLLDQTVLLHVVGTNVTGGWVSFVAILLRFALTVTAALVLIATTGFAQVCMALTRLGTPRIFATQLLFLYRYIFVLTEEGLRMSRARALRSFGHRGTGLKIYGFMLGQLLLRTMDRAGRIHRAMLCRGFDGEVRLNRHLRWRRKDMLFVCGWLGFFALARVFNLPQELGQMLLKVIP